MTDSANRDAPPADDRRTKRRVALAAAAIVALLIVTVQWWGRPLAFFRVRNVEVRGARLLRPSEVVARLKLDTTHSVWTSLDSLEARAERHPQVREAHVRRWLPSTLIVEVTENDPVAYVSTPSGMRAVDDDGRILPLDPTRAGIDLPIVSKADTGLLRLLTELRADHPEAFARISDVRILRGDELRIAMMDVPVLAKRDLSAERFDELFSVQADLARRGLSAVELDLRFKNQVIVRLP